MPAPKNRKKRKAISLPTAIKRLDAMIGRIEDNVKIAMEARALFQSANNLIANQPRRAWEGGDAYNGVIVSLTLTLAISLARLYDPGSKYRHYNERDIASIPLMIRLLKQRRCQKLLIERARNWTPGSASLEASQINACQIAFNTAIVVYGGSPGDGRRAAEKRLREFRNYRLAHSLIDDMLKKIPTYDDLFKLMDNALEVTQHALLAITGKNVDLRESERMRRKYADAFWRPALKP